MKFHLDPTARREFPLYFSTGALLRYLRNEDEWRSWTSLRQYGDVVELRHASGAVARLRVDGDERIQEARLIEGDEAKALVRAHALPLPPGAERHARRTLRRGGQVDACVLELQAALQRSLRCLDRIPDERAFRSLWRVEPEHSALEIVETPEQTIVRFAWHAHGDAFDAFARFLHTRAWMAPEFPGGRRRARTWGEAHIFLRTQRADVQDARAHDPWNHDLVVTTPEGPRIVTLHVEHPERTDPLDLGDGTSAIFSPVSLYLFASEVESKTPGSPAHVPPERRPLYVADVRLAASAVEQALRFIPAGQSHAPLTIYPSEFQRRVAQLRAPQLSREALSARFTFLMLLVEEWEG